MEDTLQHFRILERVQLRSRTIAQKYALYEELKFIYDILHTVQKFVLVLLDSVLQCMHTEYRISSVAYRVRSKPCHFVQQAL